VLTREQVQALRQTLTDFEEELPSASESLETWDNRERRSNESLLT